MQKYDVLILGGSLSGSMAGYLLGKSGKKVAIIEPKEFPRYKACGEGLSIFGQSILEKNGLWNNVLSQSSVPFYGYNLNLHNGNNLELNFRKTEHAEGYGIQRAILDTEVQNSAKQFCDFHKDYALNIKNIAGQNSSLQSGSMQWSVQTNQNEFMAKELILAWGASPKLRDRKFKDTSVVKKEVSSSLTKLLEPRLIKPRYGMAIWLEGHWVKQSNQMINVFQKRSCQFLTTPVAGNILNISILIDKTANLSKEFFMDTAYAIASQLGFDVDRIVTTQGSSEIHSAPSSFNMPGAYKIGDALERFDPIGGMGMTNALSSAVLVSKIINQKFNYSLESKLAQSNYFRECSGLNWYYRNLTRLSFETLVNWNPFMLKVAGRFPAISSNLFRLGKYFTERKIGALC